MTFTPSYAQVDAPDPINPQDLATKRYVDALPVLPAGYVIKQESFTYGTAASLAGPQTNHAWYIVTFQKVRTDTTLNVALSGSSYVTGTGGLYTYPIQVGAAGIVACALFYFNQLSTHMSWYGVASNAGGVGQNGNIGITTYWNWAGTGTHVTDANDKSILTVTEVIPG